MVAHTKVIVCFALLAAAALAGCATETGLDDDDVEVTPETGAIRGIALDQTVTPIEGVTVTATSDAFSGEATTDAEGRFSFSLLPPGAYTVRAEKVGHFSAQQLVDVVAGVADPQPLRLLLEADPASRPYVIPYKFDGFIECSVSFVLAGSAACDLAPGSNDEFFTEYTLDRRPTWVQSEMVWQSTQTVSEELALLYSRPMEGQTLLDNWEEAAGKSPLIITVNQTRAEEVGLGADIHLMLRVFNQHAEGTSPDDHAADPLDGDDCWDRPQLGGCLRGVGVTVQQKFTIFTHVFYGYEPPEGWLFVETNAAPGPPQ